MKFFGGKDRQSNFEMLRLLSMLFIVFYHLLRWFVKDNPSYDSLRAIWIPLHVGVICFVLISGFFRIRASSRGFILLLGVLFIYSIPNMFFGIKGAHNTHDVIHSLMFISRSDFWFVKTYLGLYIISPLLNRFFDHSSIGEQWYMIMAFAIVSVYYGLLARNPAYVEGKNLVNFILVYQIGHILSVYSNKWRGFSHFKLVFSYFVLNIVIVTSFLLTREKWFGDVIWRLSFPYNSPILILNAALLFMILGQSDIHSTVVNKLAENCFAIYLIHSITPLVNIVERPLINSAFHITGDNLIFAIPLFLLIAIIILGICIGINACMRPLWRLLDGIGEKVKNRIGF